MDAAGEKQNLLGMDPLMCDLHLATKCKELRARSKSQLALDLQVTPEAEHAALRAKHAQVNGRILLKEWRRSGRTARTLRRASRRWRARLPLWTPSTSRRACTW